MHARKRTTASVGLSSSKQVQSPQRLDLDAFDGERRRNAAKTVRRGYVAVGLFLGIAIVLCYLSVHHRHRRVVLRVMSDPWSHAAPLLRGSTGFHHFLRGGQQPKYVTIVMPSVVNPKKRTRRLESIADTWGPLANAIYVVHNLTEYPSASHQVYYKEGNRQPVDPYAHPQLLLVPPNITFDDGLPRLEYVIRMVHRQINPDFAFFINDHTYVIPEHACRYLQNKDPTQPLYAGRALRNHKEAFNSGAAGYFLSRQSMRQLVESWDHNTKGCVAEGNAWLQGNPGLVTAQCLHHELNTPAIDTRDNHHRHRFHAFGIVGVVQGKVDQWYITKHENLKDIVGFDESYANVQSGINCCSKETISFHYVEWKETRALFSVRQELLRKPSMTDSELKSLMVSEWPKEWGELGGYSKPLPHESNKDQWNALLSVVRKISTRHTQMDC